MVQLSALLPTFLDVILFLSLMWVVIISFQTVRRLASAADDQTTVLQNAGVTESKKISASQKESSTTSKETKMMPLYNDLFPSLKDLEDEDFLALVATLYKYSDFTINKFSESIINSILIKQSQRSLTKPSMSQPFDHLDLDSKLNKLNAWPINLVFVRGDANNGTVAR